MRAFLRKFRLNLGLKRVLIKSSVGSAVIKALHPRRLSLRKVSVADFVGGAVPDIDFRLLGMPPMNTSPEDLVPLCILARAAAARRILEVGCHKGSTTVNLALAAPTAQVVTYDIDPTAGMYIQQAERSVRDRVELRIASFPSDELRLVAEPRYDFIFIDGDHTGPAVAADTALALRIVAPGGIIAWHDYAHCGSDWLLGDNLVPEVVSGYVPALPIVHLEGTQVAAVRMPKP